MFRAGFDIQLYRFLIIALSTSYIVIIIIIPFHQLTKQDNAASVFETDVNTYKGVFFFFFFFHASGWRRQKSDTTWRNQQNECAPSEDSDQSGHSPRLIRVFTVRSMGSLGPKRSSCGQRRPWSDWADVQAELSLRWAHSHFVGLSCRGSFDEEVSTNPYPRWRLQKIISCIAVDRVFITSFIVAKISSVYIAEIQCII